jgi:hypothetical protein
MTGVRSTFGSTEASAERMAPDKSGCRLQSFPILKTLRSCYTNCAPLLSEGVFGGAHANTPGEPTVSWRKPTRAEVLRAVEIYLSIAYPDEPPSAVRARLDTLRSVPEEEFYQSAVLEHDLRVARPSRYSLRLGNPSYPHMRMIIERSPDGRGHVFRADTHDRHCAPAPKSRDYTPFCRLMERNEELSQRIEAAWEAMGIPTSRGSLGAAVLSGGNREKVREGK